MTPIIEKLGEIVFVAGANWLAERMQSDAVIQQKVASGEKITWADVDNKVEANDALKAEFDANVAALPE